MNARMYFGVEEHFGNIGKETMKELSIHVINVIIMYSVRTVFTQHVIEEHADTHVCNT